MLQDIHKATKHSHKMDLTDEMAVQKLVELASKVQQAAANDQVLGTFQGNLICNEFHVRFWIPNFNNDNCDWMSLG